MKVFALVLACLVAGFVVAQADEVVDLINTQPDVANVGDGSDPNQVKAVSCKSCDDFGGQDAIEESPDVQAAEQAEKVTEEQVEIAQEKVTKALECSQKLQEKDAELKDLMKRWNKMGDKLKTAKLIAKLDQEREVVSHVDQMARVLQIQVNSLNEAEQTMSSKLKLTEDAIQSTQNANAETAIETAKESSAPDAETIEEEKQFGYNMAKELGKQVEEIHNKNIAELQQHIEKSQKLIFENGPENLKNSKVKSGVVHKLVQIGPDGEKTGKEEIVNTLTGDIEDAPASTFMFRERSRKHKRHHKH